ncbi:hypothetical protein [Paracoccus sediminicola]|nr:hypothetical protein [Paracoccus sediminicola]WBU57446.1 hypothetical protein PAF18_03105 [Paracoccus sediminicola]
MALLFDELDALREPEPALRERVLLVVVDLVAAGFLAMRVTSCKLAG